jgi:hypothetical protein
VKTVKSNQTREDIEAYLQDIDQTVLLADGFDEAFIGVSQRINEPLLAVYSYPQMVETLMFRDEMTYEEAEEYLEYNVIGAWVGEQTPLIVRPMHQQSFSAQTPHSSTHE